MDPNRGITCPSGFQLELVARSVLLVEVCENLLGDCVHLLGESVEDPLRCRVSIVAGGDLLLGQRRLRIHLSVGDGHTRAHAVLSHVPHHQIPRVVDRPVVDRLDRPDGGRERVEVVLEVVGDRMLGPRHGHRLGEEGRVGMDRRHSVQGLHVRELPLLHRHVGHEDGLVDRQIDALSVLNPPFVGERVAGEGQGEAVPFQDEAGGLLEVNSGNASDHDAVVLVDDLR